MKGADLPVCKTYLEAVKKWKEPSPTCLGDMPLNGTGISRFDGPVSKSELSEDDQDPQWLLAEEAFKFALTYDVNLASYWPTDRLAEWANTAAQREVARDNVRVLRDEYFLEPVTRTIKIDVDNDGAADEILFFPHCKGGTEVNTTTLSSPVILKPKTLSVDVQRTLKVLRDPIIQANAEGPRRLGDGSLLAVADIFHRSAYGIFKFRGKSYFDFWWDANYLSIPAGNQPHVIKVFMPSPSGSREVCAIHVEPVPFK